MQQWNQSDPDGAGAYRPSDDSGNLAASVGSGGIAARRIAARGLSARGIAARSLGPQRHLV